jgi:tricorn protease
MLIRAAVIMVLWSSSLDAYTGSTAPLLLRDPSLSHNQMAFGYGGYIWIARRDGSGLTRLTNGGHEAKPVFSPDGSQLAYVGGRDGERAVYVMPSSGGESRRLTYHPADLGFDTMPDVLGWTPDGERVLFNSRRAAFVLPIAQNSQLFTVPVEGGAVTQVPLSRAAQASFSPDGKRIAYVPNVQRQSDFKRYRGGETTPIWIVNLDDSSFVAKIPRNNSNDFNPMWVGNTIYFLSDRAGPVTLFAYDLDSHQVRQVLKNAGLDIKSAAATTEAIIYEQFGSLHLLSLDSGADQVLTVDPKAHFPELKPHLKTIDASRLKSVSLSPNGREVLFSARGEVMTLSTDGHLRNLTHTTAAVERDPAWSPDGRSIAYLSDESGEYALHIRDSESRGGATRIDLGTPPAYYYMPTWAPDSEKIAYTDQRLNYWYIDLRARRPTRIDTDLFTDPMHARELAWSPDSRWIAYVRQLPSHLHALFLYCLATAKSYQVTDGRSDVLHIAFDKSGQSLYFTASTDTGLSAGWMDETSLQHPVTRSVYALALEGSTPAAAGHARPGGESAEVEIDLQHPERHIVALPIPARNYYDLIPGPPGVLFLVAGPQVGPLQPYTNQISTAATTVYRVDLQSQKTEQILDDVIAPRSYVRYESSFRVSLDGGTLLYSKGGRWIVQAVSGTGRPLEFKPVQIDTDPRAEWRHMYEQVWRDERDFFYDPGMHGLDLDAIRKKYEPYLERIASREDLGYLFDEMLGNLTVSHLGVSNGDSSDTQSSETGLLGADYSVEDGRYRFTRVYGGDIWEPDFQAPLTRPGSEAHVGEYLLTVNGREVKATSDLYQFFTHTAGKKVTLRVGPNADGTHAREITVVPVADETALRNFAWIEKNRRKVDEMTDGRVAYVHLPDTYADGYRSFNREYFSQVGKSAAIIDDRYNTGGIGSDYVINYLSRPLMNYWHMRYGHDITAPQEAIFGPKVMIINEMAGSGGDALPWAFRHANIGPLVGTRTWGGVVGTYTIPDDLLDGGSVWTPDLAFYSPNGSWDIENRPRRRSRRRSESGARRG